MTDLSALYQTDYAAWANRTAELLRGGRFAELDIEHLLEELGDMGKRERRELESRLLILLAHLLKWQYQPPFLSEPWGEFDGRSWRGIIVEQCQQLAMLKHQAPGLKSLFSESIIRIYPDAVDLASKETDLPPETFPPSCPYGVTQILDDHFYPDTVRVAAGA